MLGVVASLAEDFPEAAGPAFALGFGLVPVVAAIVAFVSGHRSAPKATLKAMGVWIVVALPLALLNPIIGFSTGFAAAGAFTLRPDVLYSGKTRALAVGLLLVYVTVLVFILPQAAMFAGAVTPLLVIRAADVMSSKDEDKGQSSRSGSNPG